MSSINGDLGILSIGGNAGFQLAQSIASMLEGKFVMDRDQWITSMKALKGQAAAFMVFQILLDRCFGERTFSWYKRKNLCDLLGITERALQKAMSTLEEQRMALRIQGYRPSGTKTSNLYIVNTTWPAVPDWWPTDPQADYHPSVVRALLSAFTHRCVNELPNGDRLVQLVINQSNDYPGPIIRVKAEDYAFTTDRNQSSGRSDQGISVTRTSGTQEKPVTIDRNYSSGQTGTTVPVGPEPQFRTRINQNIEEDKEQNEIKHLNTNNDHEPVDDVVVDVLRQYGISVNKKTLTKWRKLADEQTIVRVVHETMSRNGVQNVVGYVTSILEAGYTPAVPSAARQGQTGGLSVAADDTAAAQEVAVTGAHEVAASAEQKVAVSTDAEFALDMPLASDANGDGKWITFEDLTEFLGVRPHQHYKYVRFLAEVNEYIDFEGMDYDCVRYAFEIVQRRMQETRENIFYSHRVVLNILSEWANNGVRTKEEAIKYEEARRTRVSVHAHGAFEHAADKDKPLARAVQHQIEMEEAGLYQDRKEKRIGDDPELLAMLIELEAEDARL